MNNIVAFNSLQNTVYKIHDAKSKTKGFTLIELLVVISIIGILIAVGVTSYQKAVKLSRDSKRKTDLEQIRQALETQRSEKGSYPSAGNWTTDLVTYGYLSSIPKDPKTNADYTYTFTSSTKYSLCATLELVTTPPTCNWVVTNP